jgi:GntR family transcriptional regulator, galactonate operon transcriptional repressor
MADTKPDEIAASLLARLIAGEFDRLPREADLAEDYDVAKGTVREARRVLADRGVVDVHQGRPGAEIRPMAEWSLFEAPVLDALLAGRGKRPLVSEAMELRRLLEPHAAGLAAERAGEAHVGALEQAVERLQAVAARRARAFGTAERRSDAEREFRRAVLDAAGNRFLTRALLSLGRAAPARPIAVRVALAQHVAILDAVRAGDAAGARDAMLARLDALR